MDGHIGIAFKADRIGGAACPILDSLQDVRQSAYRGFGNSTLMISRSEAKIELCVFFSRISLPLLLFLFH